MHEILIILVIAIIVFIQVVVFATAINKIKNYVGLFPSKNQMKITKYYIPENLLKTITLEELYKSSDLYTSPDYKKKQIKPASEVIHVGSEKVYNQCECMFPSPDENMFCEHCGLKVVPYQNLLN